MLFILKFVTLCFTSLAVLAVDRSKFRTCSDTGFCRTYRKTNFNEAKSFESGYAVDKNSIELGKSTWQAKLTGGNTQKGLELKVHFLKSGNVRVKISQIGNERWQPTDLLQETALLPGNFSTASRESLPNEWSVAPVDSFTALSFEDENNRVISSGNILVITYAPFKIELIREGQVTMQINSRGLLHYEEDGAGEESVKHSEFISENEEERHAGKEVVDYGEDGLAIYSDGTREERRNEINRKTNADAHGESFGGHFDSMPHGKRSVGIDFSFPCAQNVYGIPEHATSLSLPTTSQGSANQSPQYSQPYRMYTLDVFEYELQESMALYGTIPLMWAHGKCKNLDHSLTSGIFWFNPSETFIDVSDGRSASGLHKESHWMSESGEIDIFLLPGPAPRDIMRQYATITGTQALPPLFSLGYHQCRWNYRDEKDVASVNAMFEELDYPYDVLWLDIEHTNGKRYFTWDKQLFPHPLEMQKNLSSLGRKMVTIIDPHIKRDDGYHIHKEATNKGLYIKNKNGQDFDGWCWPGSSSYLDFTAPHVRQWWAQQFSLDKYEESSLDLYTWNDMNEPSVFNGPEVSMAKDATNLQGVEHREWHNLYGIYMQMATQQGQIDRCKAGIQSKDASKILRPFVLTRSFWAGSQRYGAMWTGDNTATWDHLKIAAPMLLSINLGGLSFAGADVGGFFGEPGAELFTRWYQAGAFTPFFRGHAHHDTKRREPWTFGEPYTTILRRAALIRYSLLPFWYSTFFEAYETGMPVMRAMFLEFPDLEQAFKLDDQWMIGRSLLVKPVTESGARAISVLLPPVIDRCTSFPLPWYELETLRPIRIQSAQNPVTTLPVELSTIPVFIKPGSIIPRKLRVRRSSQLMHFDPYTLVVTPGDCGIATGFVYLDDETSFAFEHEGLFALKSFIYKFSAESQKGELEAYSPRDIVHPVGKISPLPSAKNDFKPTNTIERVQLAGQSKKPTSVVLSVNGASSTELQFSFDESNGVIVIKKPDVGIADNWIITVQF